MRRNIKEENAERRNSIKIKIRERRQMGKDDPTD
jgi:hypothetical protein